MGILAWSWSNMDHLAPWYWMTAYMLSELAKDIPKLFSSMTFHLAKHKSSCIQATISSRVELDLLCPKSLTVKSKLLVE